VLLLVPRSERQSARGVLRIIRIPTSCSRPRQKTSGRPPTRHADVLCNKKDARTLAALPAVLIIRVHLDALSAPPPRPSRSRLAVFLPPARPGGPRPTATATPTPGYASLRIRRLLAGRNRPSLRGGGGIAAPGDARYGCAAATAARRLGRSPVPFPQPEPNASAFPSRPRNLASAMKVGRTHCCVIRPSVRDAVSPGG